MLSVLISIYLPVYLLKKVKENKSYLIDDAIPWLYLCFIIGIISLLIIIRVFYLKKSNHILNSIEIINFFNICLFIPMLRPHIYDYIYYPIISFISMICMIMIINKNNQVNTDNKNISYSELEKIYTEQSKYNK